ncbi:zf-HC2 domain-containing protein [Acidobacteriia bacterium AH_259_A11_L15]|nr:zf-HC2 domain-containing protein [Acidobacteriia bacterium AH_259_A11_L15]
MNCKGVLNELSEYLDGNLEPALIEELRRHLECCDDCRVVVDTTRKTIEIYCNTEPMPLPQGIRERLERTLAKKLKRPS